MCGGEGLRESGALNHLGLFFFVVIKIPPIHFRHFDVACLICEGRILNDFYLIFFNFPEFLLVRSLKDFHALTFEKCFVFIVNHTLAVPKLICSKL